MSVKLNPYLNFDGNTREALEFYHSVFGGRLDISTFGEYPNPELPEEYKDKVMHGIVEADDMTIMASEGQPGQPVKFGDNMSISLSGDDDAQLTKYFDALKEGGTVVMPLEKQMWGDKFGMLVDKFKVQWLVDVVSEENKDK